MWDWLCSDWYMWVFMSKNPRLGISFQGDFSESEYLLRGNYLYPATAGTYLYSSHRSASTHLYSSHEPGERNIRIQTASTHLYSSHESGEGNIRIQPPRRVNSSFVRLTMRISSPVRPVALIEGPAAAIPRFIDVADWGRLFWRREWGAISK